MTDKPVTVGEAVTYFEDARAILRIAENKLDKASDSLSKDRYKECFGRIQKATKALEGIIFTINEQILDDRDNGEYGE